MRNLAASMAERTPAHTKRAPEHRAAAAAAPGQTHGVRHRTASTLAATGWPDKGLLRSKDLWRRSAVVG